MSAKKTQTEAFKVFNSNMNRARAFVRIFDKGDIGRTVGAPSNDEKELLRGALVFAVGSLDAYLSDLILEVVPEGTPNQSKAVSEALKAIAKTDPGLALRVALIDDSKTRKAEFRDALDLWLQEKSFHGPEKVQIALSYVGCTITWPEFDKITGITDSAKRLGQITKDRHDIVHRGKKPYVRRALADETDRLITGIAHHIDRDVLAAYVPHVPKTTTPRSPAKRRSISR